MIQDRGRGIKYCIFDPTGNITALVETAVDAADQPAAAARIMDLHPEVEQAGFVSFADEDGADIKLRMAGGEFCGNATMCAAALFALRGQGSPETVVVRASGVRNPIEVSLRRTGVEGFDAAVSMPEAASVDKERFEMPFAMPGPETELPVVRLEGIDHIIIESGSPCGPMRLDRDSAEEAVVKWCGQLGSECLGLMFLSDEGGPVLTPLVYVPGADTMFWENSCASGTTAAGMYLASKAGRAVDISFSEPAGSLRVKSDPKSGETVLMGSVVLTADGLALD